MSSKDKTLALPLTPERGGKLLERENRIEPPEKRPPTSTPESSAKLEELVLALPPHLLENFEKAHSQIHQYYNLSPGLTALIRLWLACATSTRIRMEFEHAVLDITRKGFNPHEEAYFDDTV